jgi:hypothetical protein
MESGADVNEEAGPTEIDAGATVTLVGPSCAPPHEISTPFQLTVKAPACAGA